MVGRYVRKNGLGVSGLMDMLSGQKDHVTAAAPSGWNPLGSAAGLVTGAAGAVTGAAGDVVGAGKKVVGGAADAGKKVVGGAANLAGKGVDAVGDVAGGAVKSGGSILRWLLPLFLALMAAAYFFGFQTGCGAIDSTVDKATDLTETAAGAVGDVAEGAVDVAGDVAGGAMDLAKGAFGAVNDAALKALDGVEWAAGSIGGQMMDYVKGGFKGDGRFKFNNLTFASGSAAISGTSGSEVDNLAKVLAAYPDSKINIEGYTDNTGNADANVELSKARAEAVKARLIAAGVNAARLTTEGFGAANPTASNDTAEGRKENKPCLIHFKQGFFFVLYLFKILIRNPTTYLIYQKDSIPLSYFILNS